VFPFRRNNGGQDPDHDLVGGGTALPPGRDLFQLRATDARTYFSRRWPRTRRSRSRLGLANTAPNSKAFFESAKGGGSPKTSRNGSSSGFDAGVKAA
jgi:hypothetical protein